MNIPILKNLCPPALFYLVISLVFMTFVFIQNYSNINVFCLGSVQCPVINTNVIFVVKLIYILFWTWVLNIICSAGYPYISWILVLVPFLLLFIFLGLMMI